MATTTPVKADPAATAAADASTGNAQTTPGPDASDQQQHDDSEPTGRRGKKRLGVDPSLILSEGRSKRRKTPTPDPEDGHDEHDGGGSHDPKDPVRAKRLGYGIYNRIMGEKTKEGDSLAEPFIKLPNKVSTTKTMLKEEHVWYAHAQRAFPDYYETIKLPMSLEVVHTRLEDGTYDTLKAVVTDIGQIFNNAKRYNVKESVIFQYAKKLHKITRTYYAANTQPDAPPAPTPVPAPAPAPAPAVVPKVEEAKPSASTSMEASTSRGAEPDPAGPSGASADGVDGDAAAGAQSSGRFRKRGSYMKDGPTVYKLVKPILKAIKDATSRDGSGRQIAGIFMELPDRRIFTDYYRTIKTPISLKEVEDRMMARSYEHWQEFYEDVTTMCRNAMVYNEDGSEVYQDASQIQNILESYRPSIQERLARPNEKIKVKPTQVTPARAGDPAGYPHQRPLYAQSPSPAMYASQSPQPPTLAAAAAGGHPNMYPPPHSAAPPPPQPGNFLPALPKGVVTEEIVASLDRYPAYEQSAWANSLSAVSVQIYRQLLAANDARKRGISLPSTSMLSDLPSSGRPNGISTLPDRLAPPLPTVKYLDFAFSTLGQADRSKAIRLHNMRGVVTHAVVLGSDTSELELTAYISDNKAKAASKDSASATTPTTSTTTTTTPTVETMEVIPEVSLRVNGNPGSLPKFVHIPPESTRPAGMRWIINVPPSRSETKIEVVATKPGALAETSAIYISRQC